MTDRLDLEIFDRHLDAFVVRLGGLRAATGTADRGPSADTDQSEQLAAALQELEVAEAELRVARQELLSQRSRASDLAAERERTLLRALVTDLPVPVFLLERDGIVRRANRAACGLVDVPAAYPVGKPFTVFVSLRDRGALRFAVSAAAAGTVGTPVRAELTARGSSRGTALWLAPVRVPGEAEPLVAVVALPTGAGTPPLPPAPAPADSAVAAVSGAATARRLDLMSSMTRLLLEAGGGPATLRRAAELLAAELADWVVADLRVDPDAAAGPDGTARLVRRLVVGPDGADTALAHRVRDPGPRDLAGRVAASRRPLLLAGVEDGADLGRVAGGGALGGLLGATSAVCVPMLLAGPPERLLGTLTLVRSGGRAPFELAELGLVQMLCEHIALALGADRPA